MINMTGLSYSEEFDTSKPASLYFLLNDQKNTMAASNAAVESAGLSVVAGSTRENDLVQYATSEGGRMVYPFAPKTEKTFHTARQVCCGRYPLHLHGKLRRRYGYRNTGCRKL